MSAPDKKFFKEGYVGPSYMDEMLDMYMQYDGKDVVFDRSIYGELVWSHVYGRKPMLDEEDFEILREFEDRNDVQRILMVDSDKDAHWKRCVENNEPLTLNQFKIADRLYSKLAHEYNFTPRTLHDFQDAKPVSGKTDSINEEAVAEQVGQTGSDVDITANADNSVQEAPQKEDNKIKLEKANAINQILSKKILRPKGEIYDHLENDIRSFLNDKLAEIFGEEDKEAVFTKEEVGVLKMFCERLKLKQGDH
jgi:hypothetical protein